ncbi:MAG: TraR/DksA family transcriptional regulator [Actinomycetota bacterium]
MDETDGRRRAALEAQREHLRDEIASQGADPDSDELNFVDDAGFADRSHSTEERSRAISVVRALRSNLRDVDRALAKIDAGTYGTCERCGREIGAERLDALPWALLCIDCKQEGVTV